MKYFISTLLILNSTVALAQTAPAEGGADKGAKAAAAPLSVNTGALNSANFNSIVISGQSTRGNDGPVTFVVKNSCFGTNLRSVPNPLSPISTIRLNVGITTSGGGMKYYDVQYPAAAVTAKGMGQVLQLDNMLNDSGAKSMNVKGVAVGKTVRFKTPLATKATVDGKGRMSYTRNGQVSSLKFEQEFAEVQASEQPDFPLFGPVSSSLCGGCTTTSGAQGYLKRALPFNNMKEAGEWFDKYPLKTAEVTGNREYNLAYQKWYNWFQESIQRFRTADGKYPGPYMGLPGQLSAHVKLNQSRDGKTIEIDAAFPGQEGYCGGYHSPLMVFFDDKRPKFSGESFFPLHPGKTTWPEPGAPGYFVAYDRLGDNVITKKDELFGNSDKFKNGFEALREFDTNKDNVIDKNDKEFSKLLLWQDKNGDGFSTKEELSPLSARVKSISLKYDDSQVMNFSNRAEMKGQSTFVFVEGGKEKTGEILDIWFTPPN